MFCGKKSKTLCLKRSSPRAQLCGVSAVAPGRDPAAAAPWLPSYALSKCGAVLKIRLAARGFDLSRHRYSGSFALRDEPSPAADI